MDYHDKYIKYKTKYYKLKNINQNGGGQMSRNYYLHIRFSKDFEHRINQVKEALVKYEYKKEPMPAHITLSYGPLVEYDTDNLPEEIKDASHIEDIYPGFLEKFKNKIPNIKYVSVTPFLREDNIVIKMEIKSKVLLDMIKYCRKTIPSYNKTVKEWKRGYNISKKHMRDKFPNIFKEEKSFNKNPIGALHITLITIKPDTSETDVIDIIKHAELELANIGINKGSKITADRIDIKTPITKTFIDIYKYNKK